MSLAEILVHEPSDTHVVASVSDSGVTSDSGVVFVWRDLYGAKPEVGDVVTTIGGFGRPIRGVAVGDELRWYQTEDDWRVEADKRSAEQDRKKRVEWLTDGRDWLDRFHKLPIPLQERIEKFVAERDDWLWRYGSYELFACEEAVLVWEHLGSGGSVDGLESVLSDQHSGNTWDVAVGLGRMLADGRIGDVVAAHGAMVALTGCEAYGCPHPLRGLGDGS